MPALLRRSTRISEHFCSSGPTCQLIDSRPLPDIFRRGDRAACLEYDRSERRPTRTLPIRSGFWASFPRSVRVAGVDEISIDGFFRATVPALGFASCRVVGHAQRFSVALVVRARVRARPRCHVTSLRPTALPPAYPLVGVTAFLPGRTITSRGCRRGDLLPAGAASPGAIACPSACCGADAWSFRRLQCAGAAPCLRSLHRP